MKTTVNQRIKDLREMLGMSQPAFADYSGISQSLVAKTEGGQEVKPKTIAAITGAYKVRETWLLEGKGEMMQEGHSLEEVKKAVSQKAISSLDPWENVAFTTLQEAYSNSQKENLSLREQLTNLSIAIANLTMPKQKESAANFQDNSDKAASVWKYLFPGGGQAFVSEGLAVHN